GSGDRPRDRVAAGRARDRPQRGVAASLSPLTLFTAESPEIRRGRREHRTWLLTSVQRADLARGVSGVIQQAPKRLRSLRSLCVLCGKRVGADQPLRASSAACSRNSQPIASASSSKSKRGLWWSASLPFAGLAPPTNTKQPGTRSK